MEQLSEFVGGMKERTSALEKIVVDHESRLRMVERMLMYGAGVIGAAKLLFDMFIK